MTSIPRTPTAGRSAWVSRNPVWSSPPDVDICHSTNVHTRASAVRPPAAVSPGQSWRAHPPGCHSIRDVPVRNALRDRLGYRGSGNHGNAARRKAAWPARSGSCNGRAPPVARPKQLRCRPQCPSPGVDSLLAAPRAGIRLRLLGNPPAWSAMPA